MNVRDSLLIAGASDPALQRFNNSTLLNFTRNIRSYFAQYTSERPKLISHGEKPKKAKTTKGKFKMKNLNINQAATLVAVITVLSAVTVVPSFGETPSTTGARVFARPSPRNISVFATGLNNPRGLKFGPDGNLYVAEGGIGGANSTEGCCDQVVPPVGPYTGSATGSRISMIDPNGIRTTVVDNLPSSQTSAALGNLISGATDVAFIGNTLYILLAGSGCSHGVPQVPKMPNGVLRVNDDGTTDLIANLSAFVMAFPVAHPNPADFEPDGSWYSMIAVGGNLYALEPNHGELDKITPEGQISRVSDISASQGHIVPSAIAYHGNFYVGNLNTFPVVPGSSNIYKITPSGNVSVFAEGLTAVLGVAFDRRDRMYVLETTTVAGDPTPFTGKVIRIDRLGHQTEIASGLFFPTGMTLGPDGALYVSNVGFGPPPVGLGEILRITVP